MTPNQYDIGWPYFFSIAGKYDDLSGFAAMAAP